MDVIGAEVGVVQDPSPALDGAVLQALEQVLHGPSGARQVLRELVGADPAPVGQQVDRRGAHRVTPGGTSVQAAQRVLYLNPNDAPAHAYDCSS